MNDEEYNEMQRMQRMLQEERQNYEKLRGYEWSSWENE